LPVRAAEESEEKFTRSLGPGRQSSVANCGRLRK
jgi:hypothetical protein